MVTLADARNGIARLRVSPLTFAWEGTIETEFAFGTSSAARIVSITSATRTRP